MAGNVNEHDPSEDKLEAENSVLHCEFDWKGYTIALPNFDEKLSDVPSCAHGNFPYYGKPSSLSFCAPIWSP